MKLSLIVLIFGLGFNLQLDAQNYQTIKSNQTHYFSQSIKLYALATRTDSIEIFGNDSVFYSYNTVRRDYSSPFCDYSLQAPWYGEMVVIKDNGINEFFNHLKEKISFDTRAVLLDSMLVYTYSSGEKIYGIVVKHDTESFLGFQDSVKTILLHSEMANSQFHNQEVKISKNHGWISILPFFSFPNRYFPEIGYRGGRVDGKITMAMDLIGMENPRLGITRLTNEEVFQLEVNDELQWFHTFIKYSLGTLVTINSWGESQKLIKKTNISQDSLELTFQTHKGIISNTLDTISMRVEHNSNYYNRHLPEEYYLQNDSNLFGIHNFIILHRCGKIVEGSLGNYYGFAIDSNKTTLNDSTCILTSMDSVHYLKMLMKGVGLSFLHTDEYRGGHILTEIELRSHSTDGDTCGILWLSGKKENSNPNFIVYPNPSSQFINIETKSENEKSIFIYDLKGQLILKTKMQGSFKRIDINELDEGIYILKLINGNQHSHKKIVISNH